MALKNRKERPITENADILAHKIWQLENHSNNNKKLKKRSPYIKKLNARRGDRTYT